MKLEDIGFYTLSDARAKNVSWSSPLKRCELILTDRCNFKCAYCRGVKNEFKGDITLEDAKKVVSLWGAGGLENIRFSGGEPTLWPGLLELVSFTSKIKTMQRIAISTNGSAPLAFYHELIKRGVNDFSISLDACCAKTADNMAGVCSNFDHLANVIKDLSSQTYATVGVVLDDRNNAELSEIVNFALSLGISDVRIIPSAQSNHQLTFIPSADTPILKYRCANISQGKHVRGIPETSCNKCHLVKDDMVILGGYHFPCVIYLREQGAPIGRVYGKTITDIRAEREKWFYAQDTHNDAICKRNCLDVCIDHNDAVEKYLISKNDLNERG